MMNKFETDYEFAKTQTIRGKKLKSQRPPELTRSRKTVVQGIHRPIVKSDIKA